jgi:hypothetical protein
MRALLIVCAILLSLPAHAVKVYRSVDAEGRISFSDQPPPAAVSSEVIEVRASTPAVDEELPARLQAIRDSNERLREDRLARARERQAADSWTDAPTPPAPQGQRGEPYYDVGWMLPYRRPHPGWRPPHPQPPQVVPLPNSSSLSPRGLQQRLREAR